MRSLILSLILAAVTAAAAKAEVVSVDYSVLVEQYTYTGAGACDTCQTYSTLSGGFLAKVTSENANSGYASNGFASVEYSNDGFFSEAEFFDSNTGFGTEVIIFDGPINFQQGIDYSAPYTEQPQGDGTSIYIDDFNVSAYTGAVPEPSTWAMMLISMAGLFVLKKHGSRSLRASLFRA